MMFEIIYRCKDCNEVVRTHGREDLERDVTVFMPWPCQTCQKDQVLNATSTGSLGEIFFEGEDDYSDE